MLFFAEAYDPLWEARVYKEQKGWNSQINPYSP